MTMIEEVEAGVIRNVIHCNNRASEFVPWLPRSLHWRLLLRHPDAPRAKQVLHRRDHHHAHDLPVSNVRSDPCVDLFRRSRLIHRDDAPACRID